MAKFSYGEEVDASEYLQGIQGTAPAPQEEGIEADVYLAKPNLSEQLKSSRGYTILPGGEMMPNPDRPNGVKRLSAALGRGYVDEDFVDAPGDMALTFQLGKAETEAKAREIIRSKYPKGDIKKMDLGEDGQYWIATKDGKTWKNVSDLSKMPADILSGAGVGSMLLGGPGIGGAIRSTVGTVAGSLAENAALKSFWEPERSSAVDYAWQDGLANIIGEAGTKFALVPLAKRLFGVQGSPGAKAAVDATKPVRDGGLGLLPITGGQFTDSIPLQQAYKQYQSYVTKGRVNALARFKSLRDDGLLKWIEEDPDRLKAFSKDELAAMTENAALNIERNLTSLSTGSSPLGAVLPKLRDSLDVFNKGASKRNETLYRDAFDKAILDDVALDFSRVKSVFDEIEKGTPVKTDITKASGLPADSVGVAGATSGEEMVPERYLTPNSELAGLISKGRNVSDLLSTINPDGDFVGSLQQIEAIRRGFSEFAWQNADNNQGRLAVKVLDAIDEAVANPVSGYSKDYERAFRAAQEAYGTWKSVKEIKAISKLQNSDISTYKNYVAALAKPGNGPVAELMQEMFASNPEAMESVRSTFVDHLVRNPTTVKKSLSELERNDPRLLNVLIPNKADRALLAQAADQLDRLDRSYMVKMREMSDLSIAQKAVNFYSGNKEEILQRVEDFTKYGGPNAKEALQAGFLQYMLDMAETEVSPELGSRVVSASRVAAIVDEYKNVIDSVFDNPKAAQRMKMMYDYAIKIKETGVDIPQAKGAKGGADFGTSLATAEQAGKMIRAAESVTEGKSVAGVVKSIFAPFVSAGVMAKIINFDGPIASDRLGGIGISEGTYSAMQNILKVAPIYYAQTKDREEGTDIRPIETGEDAFLP